MSSRFLSHDIVDKGTLVHIAQRSRADNLIVLLSKSLHIHFENAKKHCHLGLETAQCLATQSMFTIEKIRSSIDSHEWQS